GVDGGGLGRRGARRSPRPAGAGLTPTLALAAPPAARLPGPTGTRMFNLTTLAQILWTSLATSSYAVMFAVAFALVLKVNGVFNFAQAGLMTIAFYTAHAVIAGLGLGGAGAFGTALTATLAGAW